MIPHLFFYQLVLIALVWVFLMLYGLWPLEPAAVRPTPPKPVTPPRKRSCAPQPFIGPTRKPPCDACEEGVAPRREPACAPPPRSRKPGQHLGQLGGQGRLEHETLPRRRVVERKSLRVEERPARRERAARTAVAGVAHDRMADGGEVDADLVGPAGLEPARDKRHLHGR